MPNGEIMDGPVHGSGQTCVEWFDNKKIVGRTTPKPKSRKFLGGGVIFKSLTSKLLSTPFSNIPKWLFEKRKTVTPNPFKPFKKKTIKEKKMHIPSLQKTLIGFRDKINDIATEINKLSELETEIEKRFIEIETNLNRHSEQIGESGGHLRSGLGYTTNRPFDVSRTIARINQMGEDITEQEEALTDHKYKELSTGFGTNPNPIHNVGDRDLSRPFDRDSLQREGYEKGGKARTQPVPTSREDFKAMLIRDILELQEK
tara:strand:- start:45 stop:818 length:774 start_codon:yes stop_codon:yes gene_type:complete